MTPEQFCYWLQGYAEISGKLPSPEEWACIMDHLNLVFTKVTPDRKKSAGQVLQEEIEKLQKPYTPPGTYCDPGKIC